MIMAAPIPSDTEIAAIAASLYEAKLQYDRSSATTKEFNDAMVAHKKKLLDAVLVANKIPEGHFEQLEKKNLTYTMPGGARLVLQGKDTPAEFPTYTPEQLAYIKTIDDQIALLTLKKSQVVPVSVEKHVTRSYSVTLKRD
jgi:hypothetical protein